MPNGVFNLKQQQQGLQQSAWTGQKTPAVNYLVVAGGGGSSGGSGEPSGGGGAGGLLQGNIPVATGSAITVTIGAGGAGNTGGNQGSSGQNSVFGSISTTGGGAGGNINTRPALSGGSGGGVSGWSSVVPGQGTFNQGNAGGLGLGTDVANYASSGGGGAGTAGLPATTSSGGNGGAGVASAISGTVTTYAGGGAGSVLNAGTPGVGGVGGGGNGCLSTLNSSGTSGTANTGGGGGAANGSGTGGSGGSGIVIISYPDTYAAATSTTGSPTVSTSGSGSLSFNGSTQFLNYAAQTPFSFGTGDFTIEFWAYPTGGLAATPSYIDFRGSSSASPAPVLYNNNGTLTYFVAGANRITSAYSTLNAWVHIAICRIGTSTTMYVNGTQAGSTYTDTNNYTVGTGGPYIGQNGGSSAFYTGYLSNLRIVKGVGVYTGAFTPSTAPLAATQVAGTNIAAITGTQTSLLLNTVSGAYLADSSTNSYAAASTSVVGSWNSASPFSTGLGYKNRVYTWTSSGSITF